MISVSDYVVDFLLRKEVRHTFLVSGGGIMYLLDAIGRRPELRYYCNYHEQASVIAAEASARITNQPGVCFVTTGPGAANAISAFPAAWVDSVPVVVISGQNKQEIIADYSKLRQLGPQEANVVDMAKPVTKYAKSVRDPQTIRYELEYAWHLASSGRPGPVLLELPLDVQGAQIDPESLKGYTPPSGPAGVGSADLARVLDALRSAKRPILVAGNGIHRAGAQDVLRQVMDATGIPVVLPLTGKDVIEEEHPAYMGIFGTAGQRRANFALQSADCLLAVGAGLNVQKVGFNIAGFAPKARKIIVDIDPGQIEYGVIRPDIGVCADAKQFLTALLEHVEAYPLKVSDRWSGACRHWKSKYPMSLPEYFEEPEYVNTYLFWNRMADVLAAADIVVTGNALDTTSYFQTFRVKRGQHTMNSGWGAMGWDLPMAVGACIASGGQRTILGTGDGSFQFNVQELLTVKRYRLPVKIFILNNYGYSNIRATQRSFFEGRYVAADYDSGLANPDFRCLAAAYGLTYSSITNHAELEGGGIERALEHEGASLCEVNVSPRQIIIPKASAYRRPDGTFESRPLEDMAPFLPREELHENMHLFDE